MLPALKQNVRVVLVLPFTLPFPLIPVRFTVHKHGIGYIAPMKRISSIAVDNDNRKGLNVTEDICVF